MIQFTHGDILNSPVDIRVNTVNCKGVMGAGVALAYKARYPEMFKDYQKACRHGEVRPGSLHVWKSLMGDWVVNFPTKRDWKDPSRYEDIESGLDALRTYLSGLGDISVSLPALGCGNGGLDWNRVSSMITDHLQDLQARILVYEPAASHQAGRSIQEQPSTTSLGELQKLGFRYSENKPSKKGSSQKVLMKGNTGAESLMWLALMTSKELTEREEQALSAVAHQISIMQRPVAIVIPYINSSREHLAQLFTRYGVATVLVMPFGPLSRKSIARLADKESETRLLLLSVAGPDESWSRKAFAQSMNFIHERSAAVLFSAEQPDQLRDKELKSWKGGTAFYLRYDAINEEECRRLEQSGARPIGRRSDSREPNLVPIFAAMSDTQNDTGSKNQVEESPLTFSFARASAEQMRRLATAIELSGEAESIQITLRCTTSNQRLRSDLSQIAHHTPYVTNE